MEIQIESVSYVDNTTKPFKTYLHGVKYWWELNTFADTIMH